MTYALILVRILFGAFMCVSAANYFLPKYADMKPLFEVPAPPEEARQFMGALFNPEAGSPPYMAPMIKGVEAVGGLLLVLGLMAPLGVVILAPVIVNITAYHLQYTGDWKFAYALPGVYLVVVISYFTYFKSLFAPMPRTVAAPAKDEAGVA